MASNIKEQIKERLNIPRQILIYNYYIKNGSMKNFQKYAPNLYKELTEIKNDLMVDSTVTVTDFIEQHFLEVTDSDLTLSTQQLLREHFSNHNSLTGTRLDKNLESRLRNIARKNDLQLEELKVKLETCELYPKVMFRIINPLDIGSYKAIIQSIVLTIINDSLTDSNVKLQLLRDFEDSKHMAMYEPNYLNFIRSRIPVYVGPVHSSMGPNVSYVVQGNTYYGERDLKLETIPSVTDDILFSLKGISTSSNLTQSIGYKMTKMLRNMGNLNYIGLDEMGLFQDLNDTVGDLGLSSIGELFEKEGINFEPIKETNANFIQCKNNHELILMEFDEAQIKIDSSVVPSLQKESIANTLEVIKGEREGQQLTMLAVTIEDKKSFVYPLVSKTTHMLFKDGNTLNITVENTVMEVK